MLLYIINNICVDWNNWFHLTTQKLVDMIELPNVWMRHLIPPGFLLDSKVWVQSKIQTKIQNPNLGGKILRVPNKLLKIIENLEFAAAWN